MDEDWYQTRSAEIIRGSASCIRGNKWTQYLKHEKKDAAAFLLSARSLTESFIINHRL